MYAENGCCVTISREYGYTAYGCGIAVSRRRTEELIIRSHETHRIRTRNLLVRCTTYRQLRIMIWYLFSINVLSEILCVTGFGVAEQRTHHTHPCTRGRSHFSSQR